MSDHASSVVAALASVCAHAHTNELHVYVVIRDNEGSFGGTSCGTPSTWAHEWSLGFGAVTAPTVDVPRDIEIRVGETTRLDIEIDTGIR